MEHDYEKSRHKLDSLLVAFLILLILAIVVSHRLSMY